MSLLGRWRGMPARSSSLDEYAQMLNQFSFGGLAYQGQTPGVITTLSGEKAETVGSNFAGYVSGAFKANGVIFAAIVARQLLFSEARFQWQQMNGGKPGRLFGTPELALLERPWPNGTTSSLLARMEQDASLAGNFFATTRGAGQSRRVVRLRPDWVAIVMGSKSDPTDDPAGLDAEVVGYLYWPGGDQTKQPALLSVTEVAHYAPIPDPIASWRGMSWLTPVITELRADGIMTRHKLRFFENAATPNLAIVFDPTVAIEQVRQFKAMIEEEHEGSWHAYKTLYLGGGADPKSIGTDLKQLDFKAVQGAGETRIAAASRVPATILGISEGLAGSALNAGNYTAARRQWADVWARPAWRDAAGSLEVLLARPASARLWYDAADIAFLHEDGKDEAEILNKDAGTIRALTDGGYEPASVIAAVAARDLSLLKHTGLVPVQLQPPGADTGGLTS